jgi:hypothetical protein
MGKAVLFRGNLPSGQGSVLRDLHPDQTWDKHRIFQASAPRKSAFCKRW